MRNLKPVRDRFGDYICRRCLNRRYNVNLQPKDCREFYSGICPRCKEYHRLIVSLTATGKLKMLLKSEPNN